VKPRETVHFTRKDGVHHRKRVLHGKSLSGFLCKSSRPEFRPRFGLLLYLNVFLVIPCNIKNYANFGQPEFFIIFSNEKRWKEFTQKSLQALIIVPLRYPPSSLPYRIDHLSLTIISCIDSNI
jgi:hypothetical protein